MFRILRGLLIAYSFNLFIPQPSDPRCMLHLDGFVVTYSLNAMVWCRIWKCVFYPDGLRV